jgi:chromosome segregation and condensation protein ScpB
MAKSSATLTIRNVPLRVVRNLKSIAKRRHRSMEQEVRELLEEYVGERAAVLRQIEGSWGAQTRRPSAAEVEKWISSGRR